MFLVRETFKSCGLRLLQSFSWPTSPVKKIVWKTHVFHAIGASSTKHKDNDAAFHFPVLCHVIVFFITWCCAQVQQTNPFTAPAYTNDPQKSAAENKKAKEKQNYFRFTPGRRGVLRFARSPAETIQT